MIPHPTGAIFDRNASKYKCCCGGIDVKTGALIIAIVLSLRLTLFLFELTLFARESYFLYDIFMFISWTFAVVCLFYSIWTEKAVYCAPYIINGALGAFIAIVIITLAVVAIFDPTSFARDVVITMTGRNPESKGVDVTKAAVKLIIWNVTFDLILEPYFIWIVYKCHIFFRDQKQFSSAVIPTIQYTIQEQDTNSKALSTTCET